MTRKQRDNRRSDAAQQYHRWYKTKEWRDLRANQLRGEPHCRQCLARNVTTLATVCDHITPHRGDRHMFLAGPFQSLCKQCHDSSAQSRDSGGKGFDKGCDADGYPLVE